MTLAIYFRNIRGDSKFRKNIPRNELCRETFEILSDDDNVDLFFASIYNV